MAPRARGSTKHSGTPAGDFADFLRARLESSFKQAGDTEANQRRSRFSHAMHKHGLEVGVDAIRKWEQGASSPPLRDLGTVAKALGFSDWVDLAVAIRKFRRK